jgi:Zn-dependent protease
MHAPSHSAFFDITAWILPVLLAITLQAAAQAYTAARCGDDTVRGLGRVSLNPLRHMDPFGTVVLPGMLLLLNASFVPGYSRTLPVDLQKLHRPRRDMMLVAAAVPAANLLLAFVALVLLKATIGLDGLDWIVANLSRMVAFGVSQAVFNLLPIPPLAGAQIAIGLLPHRLSRPLAAMMPHGMTPLIALVVLLPAIGQVVGVDLDVVGRLLGDTVSAVLNGLHWLLVKD